MSRPAPQDPSTRPHSADPDGLTNEQLSGLYSPIPKRETPFLLTLEGRPALCALAVLLGVAAWFFFQR